MRDRTMHRTGGRTSEANRTPRAKILRWGVLGVSKQLWSELLLLLLFLQDDFCSISRVRQTSWRDAFQTHPLYLQAEHWPPSERQASLRELTCLQAQPLAVGRQTPCQVGFLVITASQDRFWGTCLGREGDYPQEASVRWKMEREWGRQPRGPQTHPREALPTLFNGKGRREVWSIFFCVVGFGELKKNPPLMILAQLAKHFVILALSL